MNPGGMVGLAASELRETFRLMVRPPVQERDRLRETSKFLSFVLRHRPDSIGLTLDAQGWASVDALVTAANAHGHPLDAELLHQVVLGSDKQRFALSADGSKQARRQIGRTLDRRDPRLSTNDAGGVPWHDPGRLKRGTS